MISKRKKKQLAIKRVLGITLSLIILSGMCAFAANTKLNKVKIISSNNYEMTTVTTKTKVSEILEDNHIVVLPEEKVEPSLEEEVGEDRTIKISNKTEEEKVVETAETTTNISEEQIKNAYATITEKVEVVQEAIPFETVTKDVSNSATETTDRVLQQGKDGIKEVTYKVKYQNDVEIERTKVSEVVIQEPVSKVVQVKAKATNRSDVSRTETKATENPASSSKSGLAAKVEGKTPVVKTMNMSAYTASTCGKSAGSSGYGVTSSGAKASSWCTLAAGKSYPVGTIIYIPYFQNKPNGGWFVVQDRGGAITNNRIDVYMSTYNECINFGRRNLECYIYQ